MNAACYSVYSLFSAGMLLFFEVILNVSSVIVTVSTVKKARKSGSIEKVMPLPSTPKRGGMNVEPIYAEAIWIPMIAPEFSGPKFEGVEWIMLG